MATFRLSPGAEEQIGDIVEFIAADNEAAAIRVRDRLYESFEVLASQPGIGHSREDLTGRPLKFWNVFSYHVVYDPETRPLAILGVLHGARDLKQLLKDL